MCNDDIECIPERDGGIHGDIALLLPLWGRLRLLRLHLQLRLGVHHRLRAGRHHVCHDVLELRDRLLCNAAIVCRQESGNCYLSVYRLLAFAVKAGAQMRSVK